MQVPASPNSLAPAKVCTGEGHEHELRSPIGHGSVNGGLLARLNPSPLDTVDSRAPRP
jgi:hypothetical protein